MLTVTVRDFNTFTQAFYDSVIENLQFHQLECSCGHSGCLTIHGYYRRSVRTSFGKKALSICRVICSECGHTHALLLSSMVPYSQISAKTHKDIITAYESGSDPNTVCSSGEGIDENNIKSVIRRYVKFWRERLRAARVYKVSLPDLVSACFSHYSKQFMQIKMAFNKLVSPPT